MVQSARLDRRRRTEAVREALKHVAGNGSSRYLNGADDAGSTPPYLCLVDLSRASPASVILETQRDPFSTAAEYPKVVYE